MIQKKKPPIKAFLVLLGILLVGGYYLSGLFTFPSLNASNYSDLLLEIFMHPFRNYYNDMTTIILGCALIGWVFFVAWYLQHNRNTHPDVEHGSSEWGDVRKVNEELCDRKYPENNRILSKHLQVFGKNPVIFRVFPVT